MSVKVKVAWHGDKVLKAVRHGTESALAKIGAFIRQRARSLLRTRKSVAPPGMPPSMHAGPIRYFMLFAYDSHTRSEVIGPADVRHSGVPHALEFGDGRAPHAFMAPALQAEERAGTIPEGWRGSIRG